MQSNESQTTFIQYHKERVIEKAQNEDWLGLVIVLILAIGFYKLLVRTGVEDAIPFDKEDTVMPAIMFVFMVIAVFFVAVFMGDI